MTLFEQIRKYAGSTINEETQSVANKEQNPKDVKKNNTQKKASLEDYKKVIEKMKGWSTSKINDWIEAHKEENADKSGYMPWSNEKLEQLKQALKEYGLDLDPAKVNNKNFAPTNNRKPGSDAAKYQDKVNNKNSAKVSAMNVLGVLGWKDGDSSMSLLGIPKQIHTPEEIKTVLKKEINKLQSIIKLAEDKNNPDIELCKKFLDEFKSIYEENNFDNSPEEVRGYNAWKQALEEYKENKTPENKRELAKFNTKVVKPNKDIFEDVWSLYSSQFHAQNRTLEGFAEKTEKRDFGDGKIREVSTPKWLNKSSVSKREKEVDLINDIIPPDGRTVAKELGPAYETIQTSKDEVIKTYKEIVDFLKKNQTDYKKLRDPTYKDEGYEEKDDEKNDELMNRLDRIIKTTHADYKKLLKDINTLYSWEKFKDYAKPADFSGDHWLSQDEIRGALSAALKAYKAADEEGKKKIVEDYKQIQKDLSKAKQADITNKLREQKKSGELAARRTDRSNTFKDYEVTQVLKKDIEKVFGGMDKIYYLALVRGHNESKVYLGDDGKIYILNKRNGGIMQMTYPQKIVDKHNDKEFKEKYKGIIEAIEAKASVQTKYFNY